MRFRCRQDHGVEKRVNWCECGMFLLLDDGSVERESEEPRVGRGAVAAAG